MKRPRIEPVDVVAVSMVVAVVVLLCLAGVVLFLPIEVAREWMARLQ